MFARLPNFRFTDSAITELNADEAAIKFRDRRYEFESHPSRMAFAKTIYSDGIGEIVYTDDLQFGNLHDHRGRPLTELYLTIVKNNRGYEFWYGKTGYNWYVRGTEIEYSHVFGKITCGFKQSPDSKDALFDYKSADRITNENDRDSKHSGLYMWNKNNGEVNYKSGLDKNHLFYNRPQYDDRDEVNFFADNYYYGDLASYNEETAIETVIQPTMFRFKGNCTLPTNLRHTRSSKSSL